jgi:tetratricopeptide (TPR) repeat protein
MAALYRVVGVAVVVAIVSGDMIRIDAAQSPAVSLPHAGPAGASPDDPDALYARRDDLAAAQRAADTWAARLKAAPADAESAWKLARALYWLGTHGPEHQRRTDLERGIEVAKSAIAARPTGPEGHFWLAATMGALAESFGISKGLKYRKPIRAALETVLAIDPAFQQGSADRALGRWYFKVPALFGGSNARSVEHLQRSLTYDPQSTASLFFLADTYVDMGKRAEAREVLRRLAAAPISRDWGPEDREWKARGESLARRLR